MPLTISRLRLWFAVMALAIMAAAAGFYIYSRHELHIALKNLPGKVGIDIQQSTEGFTLSKSEGGRTLFTIHASKATQFKADGRAELRNVSIVVYGRKADRFDQIYGDDFEYDQKSGMVIARGEVHIDLQGNGAEPRVDDQSAPQEVQNPIHLRTQGMTFSQKTGMAETDGVVEFKVPQASGTARGATYDSKKNELTLHSDIDIQTEGSDPTHIVAAHGAITKEPRVLMLDTVDLTGGDRKLLADHAVVDLRQDNSIEKMNATGNVRLSETGGLALRSPRADLLLGEKNALDRARFSGGVDFTSSSEGAGGRAGEVLLSFATPRAGTGKVIKVAQQSTKQQHPAPARLQTIHATRGVILRQDANAATKDAPKGAQSYAMSSDAMTMQVDAGERFSSAETDGPGELTIDGASSSKGERTVVDAKHFTAGFGEKNKLRTVHGFGAVRVASRIPGQPEKLSTSDNIVAQFNDAGEIASVEQFGNFRFAEGQSTQKELGGRSSSAERALYSPTDDSLMLTGNPRLVDGGLTLTADNIRLLRHGGAIESAGNVKTTYSELKQQPNGALLATADPVHVTAQAMSTTQNSGVAHYSGGARLWQNANIVEARTIDFDHNARAIVATGDRKHPVSSVFTQVDSKGKTSVMQVSAPKLSYADQERQARYAGGVTARGGDATVTADVADIFLGAASATHTAGPSQLDRINATGHVVVQQQERRGVGEKLVYTASDGTFVLTGGNPTLTDPTNGTVHGDSLTFYSHNDRVVVEGNGSSRTVTRTHVSR